MRRSIWQLLSLATVAYAQNEARICAWYRPRFAAVRDTFYIDGGTIIETAWQDGQWPSSSPTQSFPSGVLHGFNFSNSFEGNEPVDLRKMMKELPLTGGGIYDAPDFLEGAMFVNDVELYTYGGTPRSDSSASTILNYRLYPADGQTIFTAGPKTGIELDGVNNYVTSGGFASSASENKGWYFSGMRSASWGPLAQYASLDGSDPRAITNLSNALITADTHLPGAATWTNTTLPPEVRPRVNPNLVWLPVSKQGVLLAIGGVAYHQKFNNMDLTKEQIAESQFLSPSFMERIPVYDVESETWLLQNTTGDLPPFRAEFCSVVAADPSDTRSYDIFIYGGDNGLSGSSATYADDSVWVLSVPSFTWTQASAGTPLHGRSGHACAKPFPNQMLVIGGQNLAKANFCIQDGSVADVFDLNKHEWTRKYSWDTFSEYKRHDSISAAISGAAGADDEINALFDTTYPIEQKKWYPYANPGGSSNTTKPNNGTTLTVTSGSKSNAGAIAGGVVGGVAVLAIAALLFWFCRPAARARRSNRASTTAFSETTADSSAVSRWLRRTNFNLPPAKQADVNEGSVTDTGSNDEPVVPASHARPPTRTDLHGPAEVHGDNKFRSEMSSNEDVNHTPRSSAVFSGTTAQTRHASIEAGSSQIHEMLDESTISPRSSTQGAQGPGRPYTWGRQSTFGNSAIDEEGRSDHISESPYPLSAATATGSNNPRPSLSDTNFASHASELGGGSGNVSRPSLDASHSPSPYATPFAIPSPYSPSPQAVTPGSPSTAAMMSAVSAGPISPLLTPDAQQQASMASAGGILATAGLASRPPAAGVSRAASSNSARPPNKRHGSSLISALSEGERAQLSRESLDATAASATTPPAAATVSRTLLQQVEEDRRQAERILGGDSGSSGQQEMSEVKPVGRSMTFRRVGSSSSASGSKFVEDVSSTGEKRA